MGTVVSFTADRMLEVESSSIVRGVINMDGHLILTTRDGREYDAGYIGISGPHEHDISDVVSLEDTLNDAAANVALVQNTIEQLENGTLKELEEAIQIAQDTADSTVKVHYEEELGAGVYPQLNDTSDLGDLYYRLDGQVERWLGSGVDKGWKLVEDTVLAATINALRDAEAQLETLNTVTLPNLNDDLDAAQQTILSHTTDLGTLTTRLDDAAIAVESNRDDIQQLVDVDLVNLNNELGQKIPKSPGAILETYISDDAVTTRTIKANAITADELAVNSVYADAIQADAITANKIKAGEVTAGKLAVDSVVADNIKAGEITAAKIAAGTITGDKIAAGTITADKVIVANTVSLIPWNIQATTDPHVGLNSAIISRGNDADVGWCLQLQGGSGNDGGFASAVGLQSGTTARNGRIGAFDVESGGAYRFRMGVGAGGNFPAGVTRAVRVYIQFHDAGGAFLDGWVSPQVTSPSFTADITYIDGLFTVPALGATASVFVQKTTWSGGTSSSYFLVDPIFARAASSELIVDGAITAEKVKANAITANEMKTGTITAASGILANAVITEAKIADLAVTNAKVEGLSATKITTDTLGADRIGARTIAVDKLLVGSFENMIADINHDTSSVSPHQMGSGGSSFYVANPITVGGVNPGKHLYAVSTAGTNQYIVEWGSTNGTRFFDVEPNTEYLLKVSAAAYAGSHGIGWVIREYDAGSGAAVTFRSVGTSWQTVTSSEWTDVVASFTTGSTISKIAVYTRANGAAGTRLFQPSMRAKNHGNVIVDGTITALQLDAGAVTAGKIDAGAVTTAKLDAGAVTSEKITSATIFNKKFEGSQFVLKDDQGGEYVNFSPIDPILGNPSIAKFGTGENVVTISDSGVVSGRHATFDTAEFGGSSIDELLARTALGVVARASFGQFRGDFSTTSEAGITELRFKTPPGPKREYRIQAANLGVAYQSPDGVRFRIRMTTNGTRPSTSSTDYVIWEVPKASTDQSSDFAREYAFDGDTDVRILLTISPRSGSAYWKTREGAELSLIDEGPYVERSGVAVVGSTATVDPTETFTTSWASNWSRSYMGNNAPRSVEDGNLYQGQTPYWTAGGVQRSLFGFPSAVQSALSGATIHKIEVYIRFAHWHNANGGTARIGTHAHTSRPSTFSHSQGDVASVSGWGRGEGRWVTIPSSQYSSFASGARRGISLYTTSTSTTYYGYASPAAKLRATYTK